MKTYLVPIDFSKASVHAAQFAAALSHQTDVEHIVLLNAYYVTVYETTLPNSDMVMVSNEDVEANAAERIRNLEHLKKQLESQVRPGVEISTHLNRTHLVRAVVENVATKNADLSKIAGYYYAADVFKGVTWRHDDNRYRGIF